MMQHHHHLLLGYMDRMSKWERCEGGETRGAEENSGVEGIVLV
jgi:hypothetical protein